MKILLVFLFLILVSPCFSQDNFIQEGLGSFYADKFEGRTTASGEIYTHTKKTAAHLTLPFNTYVKVTNLENNNSVILRVNDRGPFITGRIIDVSLSAAEELDFVEAGIVKMRVEVLNNYVDSQNVDIPDQKTEIIQEPKQEVKVVSLKSIQNPYYLLDAEISKPQGYGVQIGSYKEMENLLRLAEQMKLKYNKKVIVEVNKYKGGKLYRVIIGTFQTSDEASKYQKEFVNQFPDCFVVEF
ncbi:MAG: septal ring lytic transglycosylase RlpA family protein [Bacteroidales bacterium]|nr:septal ring lytic transglycosylase RlpA family protein [Bacteroidales bacterium]